MNSDRRGLSANERLVVDLLLDHGPLARPSIARAAALSRPATADLVQRLLDRAIVVPAGQLDTGQRGPNAMTYEVRRDLIYVAGVEMQPSHAHVVVADITGAVIAEADEPRQDERADLMVARALSALTDRIGIPTARLHSVVIGTPGVVAPDGDIDFVSGHDDWVRGQRDRLESAIGAPVRLENDVNLAAFAEIHMGAGWDAQSFALVRCDEGIGVGIVIDQALLRGAHGYAGEVGYVPLGRHYGRPDEGYQSLVSRAGLTGLLAELGLAGVTPEQLLADPRIHADRNDEYLAEVAQRFALLCLTICSLVDPECVVLSGSVPAAGGERLTAAITRKLHEFSPMRPKVAVTTLGDRAVVEGAIASALAGARDDLFRPAAVRPSSSRVFAQGGGTRRQSPVERRQRVQVAARPRTR